MLVFLLQDRQFVTTCSQTLCIFRFWTPAIIAVKVAGRCCDKTMVSFANILQHLPVTAQHQPGAEVAGASPRPTVCLNYASLKVRGQLGAHGDNSPHTHRRGQSHPRWRVDLIAFYMSKIGVLKFSSPIWRKWRDNVASSNLETFKAK